MTRLPRSTRDTACDPLDDARPWQADIRVEIDLVQRLLGAQFPQLGGGGIQALGAGWDNDAFLVDDTWVFRFPRRAAAVALIEQEARLLPALAPRLPVAIPVPVFLGQPGETFPWPFTGYRSLPGRTACDPALDDAARAALAAPLGAFLRCLHACDPVAAAAAGTSFDTLGRTDVALQSRRSALRLRRLHAAHADLARLGQRALVAARAAHQASARDAKPALCLVHGDLYARHLLVDPADRLAGVIDWGDLHLGDPAVDLAVAFNFLPPAARSEFAEAYGPVSPETWTRACFRATCHSIGALVYALDQRDGALTSAAQRALVWLASA